MEYCPGKEGGKPDALTRQEGNLPTAGDKRLMRNVGILLPKERYWDIPETEEIKLNILETTEFQDKDEGEIQKASDVDYEIQDIIRNLDQGRKEMKGIALGLCQWKDGLLWFQGKIWVPREEEIGTALIAKTARTPTRGTWPKSKNYPTSQPTILLAKDNRRHQRMHKNLRDMSKE